MTRRVLVLIGSGLVVAGLVAALGALALPWLSYRLLARRLPLNMEREGHLLVFDAPRGTWFLALLGVLLVLVALAGLGTGRARQVGGLTAPVVGLVAAVLVVTTIGTASGTDVAAALGVARLNADVSGGAGGWLAVAAAALLCFGGGFLSLGRSGR